MSKISNTTVGDLIEFQRGYDLPKSGFINGTIPVISSNGILGYHNLAKVKGPGITIGRSGTVGIPHYIKEDFFPHNTSLFIKDFKNNDPKYIFYLIKTLGLNEYKSGSGVPTMNRNHLHPIKVRAYLDCETQSQIAKVLSDLDSKIELNNKINAELEAMAKLIYDYWFVQFEFPFDFAQGKPNEDGKPYKSSGGKMVWNEELKRDIPEGWEVKAVNSIIEVKDGTHDSPKSCDVGFKLITSKNLKPEGLYFENSNTISAIDYAIINKRSKVDTGDILYSMIGNIGTVYKVEEKEINFAIKNVALFKSSQKQELRNYLYLFLTSNDMSRYLVNEVSGSIQKFIGLGSLRKIPFLYNMPKIEEFNLRIADMFKKLENSKLENQKLSELRDWLLPMLMNGQVRIDKLSDQTID